jgi:hypothetical protein
MMRPSKSIPVTIGVEIGFRFRAKQHNGSCNRQRKETVNPKKPAKNPDRQRP